MEIGAMLDELREKALKDHQIWQKLMDTRRQSISLNDFLNKEIKVMTESQRMIYVACSRASQFLALAVPKSITDEKIKRALDGIDIDIRNINLQGELAFTD